MIDEGGYESESSHLVYLLPSSPRKGLDSEISAAAEKCLSDHEQKNVPNGYGRYHVAVRAKSRKAFFVLSTGRCGTMTLAHILNTATNARVWHHPQPDPIVEARWAYQGKIDKRRVFWQVRYPIVFKAWSERLIHGETNHLMTPFADMLSKDIPQSKFVVLLRHPQDFVRSGMRRNYYNGHPWDFGRLRPEEETPQYRQWRRLDRFEKICWLWRETYMRILDMTESLPSDRVKFVRFEELVRSPAVSEDLFLFLGLKNYARNAVRSVLRRRYNEQKTGSFPVTGSWNSDLWEKLYRQCGKLAQEFGYDSVAMGRGKGAPRILSNIQADSVRIGDMKSPSPY
jgi:hypothetical protein